MEHTYRPFVHNPNTQCAEHRAWLILSQTEGLNLKDLWKYISLYSYAQTVLEHLRHKCGQGALTKIRIPPEAKASALEEHAHRRQERILTPADSEYPRQLFDLPQPPAALFVAGQRSLQAHNQISIVGSRLATPYGMSLSATLARNLAERGVVITSGLARGIDAQAHRGALKGGGHTIAVIGSGLDVYYPRENIRLQKRLAEEGNVVSEYAYGSLPNAWHFPARNRIIAALSLGTIIVQASTHSGALITANIANDLGREVMVVPGAIDVRQSSGCLQLLLEGANPVRHVCDVFDVLKVFEDDTAQPQSKDTNGTHSEYLSAAARQLLHIISPRGDTVDTLAEKCSLSPGLIAAILHQLGVTGYVQSLPEGMWIPTF